MSVASLRLEQDLAYYQSLLTDQLKEIQNEREAQRHLVNQVLAKRIPEVLESLYPRNEQQLLRLRPNLLNEQEKQQAQSMTQRLNRLRSGGCYNLNPDQEQLLRQHNRLFGLDVPARSVTLCFDIAGPLESGLVNANLGLVNVIINTAPNESYQYPLTNEQSAQFLNQAIQLGVDPSRVPQMRFPQVEQTQEQIQLLTLQMNPNAFI